MKRFCYWFGISLSIVGVTIMFIYALLFAKNYDFNKLYWVVGGFVLALIGNAISDSKTRPMD